ncbi:MAG: DsbA family protein, partial [Actinomycetia bacterium]|nr:DsbA family protein [Actinomycetes bacterium]
MRQDNTTGQAPVVIELWADLGCPWCYLGKHRLQPAIAARPDAERFEVKIRSFELHPEFSRVPEAIDTALIRAYGDGAPAVMQAERDFQSLARGEGLVFELARLSANTFEVHRVTHYADGSGKGLEFFSRVQDQLFAGEVNPYAADTLASLAESLVLSGT